MLPVLIQLDVGKLEAGMQMFGSQRLSLTSLPLTFPNLNACLYSGTLECPSLLRTLSTCLYFTPSFSTQQSMFGEGSQTSSCCRKFSTALVGASDGSKGLLGLQYTQPPAMDQESLSARGLTLWRCSLVNPFITSSDLTSQDHLIIT